jgi:DNA-binding XRE family transcriptional regulator
MSYQRRWTELQPRIYLIQARGEHTQTEIAKEINVKQQTYSHWERGRSTPSLKKILLLEKVLNTPKEMLFFDVFNSANELEKIKPSA